VHSCLEYRDKAVNAEKRRSENQRDYKQGINDQKRDSSSPSALAELNQERGVRTATQRLRDKTAQGKPKSLHFCARSAP
jgi:hypothetical protein